MRQYIVSLAGSKPIQGTKMKTGNKQYLKRNRDILKKIIRFAKQNRSLKFSEKRFVKTFFLYNNIFFGGFDPIPALIHSTWGGLCWGPCSHPGWCTAGSPPSWRCTAASRPLGGTLTEPWWAGWPASRGRSQPPRAPWRSSAAQRRSPGRSVGTPPTQREGRTGIRV